MMGARTVAAMTGAVTAAMEAEAAMEVGMAAVIAAAVTVVGTAEVAVVVAVAAERKGTAGHRRLPRKRGYRQLRASRLELHQRMKQHPASRF
jgi:hypothetical protein